MTVSELLTHAELQASVWTDVMIALRRLVPPADDVLPDGVPPLPVTTAAMREELERLRALYRAAPCSKPQAPTAVAKKATPAASKRPAAQVDRKRRDLLDWATREARVLDVLRAATSPRTTAEVGAKTRLSDYATKETLRRLVAAGSVVHTGATSSSRWSARPPAPAAAKAAVKKTPAATTTSARPPRTAPPAPSTVKADGKEFDVVFAGGSGLTSVGRS